MDNFVELISKPIADGFFPVLITIFIKDKMYDPERDAKAYSILYDFVANTVSTYFEQNTFTNKQELDYGIEQIVQSLSNYYSKIIANPDGSCSCPSPDYICVFCGCCSDCDENC